MLAEKNPVVMSAHLFKAKQAVGLDFFDDKTHFIRMGGKHQRRAGMRAHSFNKDIAQSVHPGVIRGSLEAVKQVTGDFMLKAARAGNGNQLLEQLTQDKHLNYNIIFLIRKK